MDWILAPWPWYVSGPLIALTMFILLFCGKYFGMSSNMKTMCTIAGAGKTSSYFRFNWKEEGWNLIIMLGAVLGGFIATHFLSDNQIPAISTQTIEKLNELGFTSAGKAYLPTELYGLEVFKNVKALSILLTSGILIGFGSRYAGGCTSGHSISGISDLQIPSFIATIGFFIGGLVMVHFIFPILF